MKNKFRHQGEVLKKTHTHTHITETCNNRMEASDRSYYVVLDELLVAQEDLLPAEDGSLRPGLEGSGAGVHSR